jgi:hypothetical protein
MNELLARLNAAGVRHLVIGGQAIRLAGMPRFSMDWDFFVPPRDLENFTRLNTALSDELDLPVVPLGPQGQDFIQTYQTRWGIVQFHLLVPGIPRFDDAELAAVVRTTEDGFKVKCLSGLHLLASKQAADRPEDQADIAFLLELQKLGKLN